MDRFHTILSAIRELNFILIRGTSIFNLFDHASSEIVRNSNFAGNGREVFGEFGEIVLPYTKMGKITSLNLFGLDELLIFSWYLKNQNCYKNVADLGANIGLHSILMSKLGWSVQSFEADPEIVTKLKENLDLNSISNVNVNNKAVSNSDGSADFIRVKGNLTGSHLAGAKKSPYGELDFFKVPTKNIKSIMAGSDLLKIDVEGSEGEIISATDSDDWHRTDAILEIGSMENAQRIFEHLSYIKVNMYSQKNSWERVLSLNDLPFHHTEGVVFCSTQRNF